jgi:hypothetical protein
MGLFATQAAEPGGALAELDGTIAATPTVYSIEMGSGQHLAPLPDVLQANDLTRCRWRFLNHSCAPNCWIDGRTLRALRRIEAHEQLTFDYNTTEWSMDVPFTCACGACHGDTISGYAHLSAAERARREPHCAAHLRSRVVHGNA